MKNTWKIDNFFTHCRLFQNTQRTGHILAYLLIATEQRKDMNLVSGRCSLDAFSLRIYLSDNKHQDQFLQPHFKGLLENHSCTPILCMHNILRHIICINFNGSQEILELPLYLFTHRSCERIHFNHAIGLGALSMHLPVSNPPCGILKLQTHLIFHCALKCVDLYNVCVYVVLIEIC